MRGSSGMSQVIRTTIPGLFFRNFCTWNIVSARVCSRS